MKLRLKQKTDEAPFFKPFKAPVCFTNHMKLRLFFKPDEAPFLFKPDEATVFFKTR